MKEIIKTLVNRPLSLVNLEIRRKAKPKAPEVPEIPVEANEFERTLIAQCGQYTMTGPVRMWALIQSLKHVANERIHGDLVECGVWKGGNLALMRMFANFHQLTAKVIGYDTFEGMPEATDYDVDFVGNFASAVMKSAPKDENIWNIHAYAGIQQVENNLRSLDVREGVRLIKGKVESTLTQPENVPDRIAVLRLDTDWYESTKVELEVLYPKLAPGGVLIIDDYGHFKGAQKAVDEYFKDENIWLHYVDYTCRLLIKR